MLAHAKFCCVFLLDKFTTGRRTCRKLSSFRMGGGGGGGGGGQVIITIYYYYGKGYENVRNIN